MIKLLFLVRGQIFKKQTKQTKSSSSVSEQKTFNLKSTNRYLQFKKIFLQNNVMFCLHAELPQPSALRVDVGRVSPPVHLRLLTLCHLPFVSSSSSFSLRSPQPAGRSHDENTSHTHTVEKCRQASVQSFTSFFLLHSYVTDALTCASGPVSSASASASFSLFSFFFFFFSFFASSADGVLGGVSPSLSVTSRFLCRSELKGQHQLRLHPI